MKSAVIEPHPLDHPGAIKILLGVKISKAIASAGGMPFLAAITMPDATSPPHAAGQLVLHCVPSSKPALDAAYRCASGTHRAVKIRTPKTP